MSRPIAVLRPEPGNRVTAAVIEAAGRRAIRLPLFEARPMAWEVPDPARFDALILTSANALRHGGPGLDRLLGLPVHAVGEATAKAARRVGFEVADMGDGGATELVARARAAGICRALHLGGRERMLEAGGIVAEAVTVYASEPLAISPRAAARLRGSVALVQSARAGARLAEIVSPEDRATIAVAAVSVRAAEAAGPGWSRVALSAGPAPGALIDTALGLTD